MIVREKINPSEFCEAYMRAQSAASQCISQGLPQMANLKAIPTLNCDSSASLAQVYQPQKSMTNFYSLDEPAPTVSALAAGVFHNGKSIYEKNSNEHAEMASLTKIMTLFTALKLTNAYQLDPERVFVCIPKYAAAICGTSARLRADEFIKLADLFYALMLPSGNDAACVLSSFLGQLERTKKALIVQSQVQDAVVTSGVSNDNINTTGFRDAVLEENIVRVHFPEGDAQFHSRSFVKIMNQEALRLQMRGTQFSNPHGLSDKANKSCVADYGKLCHAAMGNRSSARQGSSWVSLESFAVQQTFRKIVTTAIHKAKSFSLTEKGELIQSREYSWENTNKLLLRDKHVIGIKTGSTPNAGFCLATHYARGDKELQVIVLNCKDDSKRWLDSIKLAEWAFKLMKEPTSGSKYLIDEIKFSSAKKSRTVQSAFPYVNLKKNNSSGIQQDTLRDVVSREEIKLLRNSQLLQVYGNIIEQNGIAKDQRINTHRNTFSHVRPATSTLAFSKVSLVVGHQQSITRTSCQDSAFCSVLALSSIDGVQSAKDFVHHVPSSQRNSDEDTRETNQIPSTDSLFDGIDERRRNSKDKQGETFCESRISNENLGTARCNISNRAQFHHLNQTKRRMASTSQSIFRSSYTTFSNDSLRAVTAIVALKSATPRRSINQVKTLSERSIQISLRQPLVQKHSQSQSIIKKAIINPNNEIMRIMNVQNEREITQSIQDNRQQEKPEVKIQKSQLNPAASFRLKRRPQNFRSCIMQVTSA